MAENIFERYRKMLEPAMVATFYTITLQEARQRLASDQQGTLEPMLSAIQQKLDQTRDTSRA